MRGTYVPPLSCLVTPTSIAGGYKDISDTLGCSFAFCSSDAHYTPTFLQVKSHAEAFPPLSMRWTTLPIIGLLHWLSSAALSHCSSTSAGPDDVHYDMLKHLPPACLSTLLVLYNTIWLGNVFPSSWQKAVIIPSPSQVRTTLILLTIALLPSLVAFVRSWNAW